MTVNVTNLEQLAAVLQKKIQESLADNVADAVKFEEQKQIQYWVYDAYDPFEYSRRGFENDGLQDLDNMVAVVEKRADGFVLSVVNEARGNEQESLYIAPLIEYGQRSGNGAYDFPYNRDHTAWKFLQSRPFTRETVEALHKSKKHILAMKEGLIERGLTVI